jgi:transcriptional repressor NrdR
MRCPFCRAPDTRVVDSRLLKEGAVIRRRRNCDGCKRRFTTYEQVDELLPMVAKKDDRREPFDRAKIVSGLKRACEKRPVSMETIEAVADRIERQLQERGDKEVSSRVVGEAVMRELQGLDAVAYVRFASVYRNFQDAGEFQELVDEMTERQEREALLRIQEEFPF